MRSKKAVKKEILGLYINTDRHGGYNMPLGFYIRTNSGAYPVVIFRRPKHLDKQEYLELLDIIQKLWEKRE